MLLSREWKLLTRHCRSFFYIYYDLIQTEVPDFGFSSDRWNFEPKQDAAGLTQLSSTVEDVFASGDLPRAADTLANMRHCLSAVGEVSACFCCFLFV